ncbi:sensor domain-containing diguanylate cyclase [Shewanella aestuarii]|uniref:Sensor domain-containing diguanylate cyclase n=1 Tax=Shewanella aestuarii TaxID=1028752 RepID=A0A6G9QM09_9GAMM|nr:sensor domain-containing diguanylate cyclase [Shewanella aestuarii]QIR15620.1 sensor domain-containing diguanylate cyclase [Shewanella aestuarii]
MLDHKIEQVIIDSLLLTKDGVGIFDADDRLVFCNEALEMLLGIPAEKALNQTFSALCFRSFTTKTGINIEADCFDTWISAALTKRRSCDYRTFETDTVEGKHFIVTEQIVQQHFLYLYITDITEKKQNEQKLTLMSQELQKLATTDYLTGIYNRRYFYETAKVEFSRSQREATKLSVLMLDLDKFKGINDSYGHNAGDLVLQTFACTVGDY